MPQTFHNVTSYYESLEQAHAPNFSAQRSALWGKTRKAFGRAAHELDHAGRYTQDSLHAGLQGIERSTGLKVGNVVPAQSKPAVPAAGAAGAPYERADKAKLI